MKNPIRLGVYAAVGLVDKLREEVDELVRRGELKKKEGKQLIETVEAGFEEREEQERRRLEVLGEKIETKLRRALNKLPPVAVKRELDAVGEKLHNLEERVARLETAEKSAEESVEVPMR